MDRVTKVFGVARAVALTATLAALSACDPSPEELNEALREAIGDGNTDAVAEALEDGADVGHRFGIDSTVLHLAVRPDRVAVLPLLLEAGAEPNLVDEDGQSPLHTVSLHSTTDPDDEAFAADAIAQLVAAGADVSVRDHRERTPLALATFRGNAVAVEALLAAGADPDARSEDGDTPLILAARQGYLQAAVALLEAGADRDATNDDGRTALDLARSYLRLAPPRNAAATAQLIAILEAPPS